MHTHRAAPRASNPDREGSRAVQYRCDFRSSAGKTHPCRVGSATQRTRLRKIYLFRCCQMELRVSRDRCQTQRLYLSLPAGAGQCGRSAENIAAFESAKTGLSGLTGTEPSPHIERFSETVGEETLYSLPVRVAGRSARHQPRNGRAIPSLYLSII